MSAITILDLSDDILRRILLELIGEQLFQKAEGRGYLALVKTCKLFRDILYNSGFREKMMRRFAMIFNGKMCAWMM